MLITGFLNLSTCVSRKKNIANLYSYWIFHKDGGQEEYHRFDKKMDFDKYSGFKQGLGSFVLSPINSITEHFVPHSLVNQNLNYLQKPFNYLDPINNKIFDSHENTNPDLYRLYRRKRRIIKDYDSVNTNDNKIERIATPKPNIQVEKSTNDDVKHTYEVYDLESDANEIDFNHIFKFSPFDKKAVKKGHGYLTFGKRYSFYVSTNPNSVTEESSNANENSLADSEDKVTDVD